MLRKLTCGFVTLAVILATVPAAAAGVSRVLTVQGRLDTSGGAPASGTFKMIFSLYESDTALLPVWTQTKPGTVVADGIFDVALGPVPDAVLDAASTLWLETTVETETLPRQQLSSVAYALLAERASVAGTALDVGCTKCVESSEVDFVWAEGKTKGGAAADLDCEDCVDALEIADGAIATTHLQNNVVTKDKAGFTYASSDSKDGAANEVDCPGCVDGTDITPNVGLSGDVSVTGSVLACTANGTGCSVRVSESGLYDHNNGWLHAQVPTGLRVRDVSNGAFRPLEFGGGSSFGALAVTGDVTVNAGKLGVGVTTPGAAVDVFDPEKNQLQIRRTGYETGIQFHAGDTASSIQFLRYSTKHAGLVFDGERLLIKGMSGGPDHDPDLTMGTNEAVDVGIVGRLGIGTKTPGASLSVIGGAHVGGESNPGAGNLVVDGRAAVGTSIVPAATSVLHLYSAGQTTLGSANQLLIGSANVNGALAQIGLGWTNSTALQYAPGVLGFVATDASSNVKGDLFLATRDVTSDSAPTERMRVTSAGNVGIGTSAPAARLEVAGDIRLPPSGTATSFAATAPSYGLKLEASSWDADNHAEEGAFYIRARGLDCGAGECSGISPDAGPRALQFLGTDPNGSPLEPLLELKDGYVSGDHYAVFHGKVGIGTDSPQAPLDIPGDVRIHDVTFGARETSAARSMTGTPADDGALEVALTFETGTAVDSSGKGRNGTVGGTVTEAPGAFPFSKALRFNGSQSVVLTPASYSNPAAWTVMAWVRRDSATGRYEAIVQTGSSTDAALYVYPAGDLGYWPIVHGGPGVPVGVWTHTAATYDGSNIRVYQNGDLVATGGGAGAYNMQVTRVGGHSAGDGETFLGLIDEVRVYSRAMSQEEIRVSMGSSASTCPSASAPPMLGFCVWHIGGYNKTFTQAAAACREQGGRLCTLAEVSAAQAAGAQWCSMGWTADRTSNSAGYAAYPMQTASSGCGSQVGIMTGNYSFSTAWGANCCRP